MKQPQRVFAEQPDIARRDIATLLGGQCQRAVDTTFPEQVEPAELALVSA